VARQGPEVTATGFGLVKIEMHTSARHMHLADSRSLAECALIGRFAACYARLGKDWPPNRGSTIPVFGGARTKGSGGKNLTDLPRTQLFPPHLVSAFLLTFTVYVTCPFLPAPLPAKCIDS